MMPQGAIPAGRIFGIKITVDWSWFLVLFLIIFWLSGYYREILGADRDDVLPFGLAAASALLFFGSILLHEMGHAVVARREGIGIAGVTLWMFGGVAMMERDTDTAGKEFRIAIAGPLVTVAIIAACIGVGLLAVGGDEFVQAIVVDPDAAVSGPLALLAWLALINTLVLVFNMLPAFPLDGGRVARAIAWWITGDRGRATRIAANLGQGFSWLFMATGVFLVLRGLVISGLWLLIVGFFLSRAAAGAASQSRLTTSIEGLSVSEVMDSEPVAISDEMTITEALDTYFLRYRWPWFPAVDASGRFLGLVGLERLESVPEERRPLERVGSYVDRDLVEGVQIADDASLEAALGRPGLRDIGALIAVDGAGRLSGVLTAEQIAGALRGATRRGEPTGA